MQSVSTWFLQAETMLPVALRFIYTFLTSASNTASAETHHFRPYTRAYSLFSLTFSPQLAAFGCLSPCSPLCFEFFIYFSPRVFCRNIIANHSALNSIKRARIS